MTDSSPPSNPSIRRVTLIIALACGVWAILLGADIVPSLRGDFGWRWPYAFPPAYPVALIGLAALVIVYGAVALWLAGLASRAPLMAWSVVGVVALTFAVLSVSASDPAYEMVIRTLSNLTTGWQGSAAKVDPAGGLMTVLRNWPAFAASFGSRSHLAVSPPGWTILWYAADKLLEVMPGLSRSLALPVRSWQCHDLGLMSLANAQLASAWLGLLAPVGAALTVFPLYGLGARLLSERQARIAVACWPLIPSLLMFTPNPSTVYPLLSSSAILLLFHGLIARRLRWVALAGVVVSIISFFAVSLIGLIFLAGMIALLAFVFKREESALHWGWLIQTALAFALGLVSVWAVFWAITQAPPWTILLSALSERAGVDRPYLPWLYLQINDFGSLTGWPLFLAGCIAAWQSIRRVRSTRRAEGIDLLILGYFATLIVSVVSGASRGEVGRIWLYMTPFLLLAAVSILPDGDARPQQALLAAQAAMVVVVVAFIHVIDSGLQPSPARPPALGEETDLAYLPAGAVFDNVLRLNAFAGEVRDGDTLVVWLEWESSGQVERPYYFSLIPVAPDGAPAPEATLAQPFHDAYPATCWSPASGIIRDRVEIPIDPNAPPGDWWVSLSLVDGDSGYRPPVILPDGATDQQVGIGPFR